MTPSENASQQSTPQIGGKSYRLAFEQHTYSWDLLMIDDEGNVGVAASGPIQSAELIGHILQAGGAVRRDGNDPGAAGKPSRPNPLILPGRGN